MFPVGVKPGFDASHPAAYGFLWSAISAGTNLIQIAGFAPGQPATVTGSPGRVLNGVIGVSTSFAISSTVDCSFAGFPTTTPSFLTMAMIIAPTSLSGSPFQVGLSDNTGTVTANNNLGYNFGFNGVWSAQMGTSQLTSTQAPVLNAPYFAAVSLAPGVGGNFVTSRLDRGGRTLAEFISSAGTLGASTGTWNIGNQATTGTRGIGGNIAAAMASAVLLSIPQLRAWAADPWSYWYPQVQTNSHRWKYAS